MSKAFMKEDGGAAEEAPRQRRQTSLPPDAKNYMTPDGAQRLQAELTRLLQEDRLPALSAAQEQNADEFASLEDRAETRKILKKLDEKIRMLEASLRSAEIVTGAGQDPTRVGFGARVTVRGADGEEFLYRIVGTDEVDLDPSFISWVSPLAKAMMQAQAGDHLRFQAPRGEQNLQVVAVRYD